jgi:hypothetical protein
MNIPGISLGYVMNISGIRQFIPQISIGYLRHILHLLLHLFTKNNQGPGCWCQISRAGQVAPAPPAQASERRYSTGSPPMQAAWHAGDLPKCICTDLRLTVGLGYDMWNVPQSADINLSGSSPARASRLISRQVRLTEVGPHGTHSRQFPVCAVISGGCLISRHSTSKQAAAGPIPEIKIKSFFCISGRSSWYTLLLPVILFKMCVKS